MSASVPNASLTADDIVSVVAAYRLSASVVAMAELGVPDALTERPQAAAELAETLDVAPGPLARLLRVLVSRGALLLDEQGRYANTGLSAALVSGPDRDMLLGWAALPSVVRAWSALAEGIRAGASPFALVNGKGFHDLLSDRPDEAAAYDRAMSSTTGGFADLANALELSGEETLVVVGGGNGTELVPIIERYPRVRFTLLELPDTAAAAEANLTALGIRDRVEIAAADARTEVPAGDAYVMSTVLRCLDDASVVAVLRSCRRAAHPGATLHAMEMPLPEGPPTHPQAMADLTAWVAYGGADRTVPQWRALFDAGGWTLEGVVTLTAPYAMLKATAAEA